MNQCIPTLSDLLVPFGLAFRQEVSSMFVTMTVAWIVCLGRRTISRVWETTGQAKWSVSQITSWFPRSFSLRSRSC
jgi:hypothetical protein